MSSKKSSQEDFIDFSDLGLELDQEVEDVEEDLLEIQAFQAASADSAEDPFIISPKPRNERRNWKRFAIDGAFAMVVKPPKLSFLKPVYIKLGPVKDIGMKGLAIHYVEKRIDEEPKFKKAPYLSIVQAGGQVIVDKIPFTIVNTFKVADLPGDKEIWNLCVSFKKLLPMQRVQIEKFIERYGDEVKAKLP